MTEEEEQEQEESGFLGVGYDCMNIFQIKREENTKLKSISDDALG